MPRSAYDLFLLGQMSHGAAAPHADARLDRTKSMYRDMCGPVSTLMRECEIATLPAVEWKGKTLRTIRCHGTSGKGPHDCNVPEALLWSLMSLKHFLCVYHSGDR